MKQYLVTENVTPDPLKPGNYLVELPPNGKWLTREQVEAAMIKFYANDDVLDELFGGESE